MEIKETTSEKVVSAAAEHAGAIEQARAEQFENILNESRKEAQRIAQEAMDYSQKSIDLLHVSLTKHFRDDLTFQASTIERFDSLATKDDAKEILSAIKTVHIGFGIVKMGWKSFLTIGAVAGALAAIFAFGKIIILWLTTLLIKN